MFNRKTYTLMEAPATEPVSLSDVKAFLKIDGTDEDIVLNMLIASARRAAEEYMKRAILTQTWLLTMDHFDVVPGRPPFIPAGHSIQLSRQPIRSITSVQTTDRTGAVSTVPASTYWLDAFGRIILNSEQSWPSGLRAESAVGITFVAGWEDADNVPPPIRQGILQHVAASFSSRVCGDIPEGAKAAYDPFRLAEAFGAC